MDIKPSSNERVFFIVFHAPIQAWEKFQMREKSIRSLGEMSSSANAYVDDAAAFAKALTLADMVRAGDYGNAMRRVARKVGVCHSVLKHLHYSAPKRIETADFVRLGTAYGQQKKSGRVAAEVEPRTALGRWLVEAGDALNRVADEMDRSQTLRDDE